jgi:hypothetical protein
MPSGKSGRRVRAVLGIVASLSLLTVSSEATPGASPASSEEAAITAVLANYARAIETRDIELFRSVKPVLSPEEEQRLRAAFANTEAHTVKITLRSIEVKEPRATVHLARRDTIGTIVASFPQTIVLTRSTRGWSIQEIGK